MRFELPIMRQRLLVTLLMLAALLLLRAEQGLAQPAPQALLAPARIGGASNANDQRDADLFPAIAYDAVLHRYLAIWMSARNAQSSTAGFDVYGIFLDENAQPLGAEFRISDSNTAARSSPPTVAAGGGEFVVAWAVRGSTCTIAVQRVTTSGSVADQLLATGAQHRHSPNLSPQNVSGHYALAFVEGDDYLPQKLFNGSTADCGDNAASTSRVRALDISFNGASVVLSQPQDVSPANGALRPRISYSSALSQYLVAWEDRRDAGAQAFRFDVYAQRLGNGLGALGGNVALATGGDYTNGDGSATWTPRPVVASGRDRFMVLWFDRQPSNTASIWSTLGRVVSGAGELSNPFTVTRATLAQDHTGNGPSGFLALAYTTTTREFVLGMSSSLETISGYFSYALVQRLGEDGQLLRIDGTPQATPGIGTSVDAQLDDRVGVALAVRPSNGAGTATYTLAYSKHAPSKPEQDFDIWGARLEVPAPFGPSDVYVPLLLR